jgi:hypothetical protein
VGAGFLIIKSTLIDGLKSFKEFETGMRNVNSIINVNESELEGLSDGLQDVQKRLGTPHTELTGAMYQ